ncbi:hypothetical protein SAMN05216490_3437 [Mucilaginibacter mallensis]|uniref:MetA-pathway of phenol degradation n=2 Tax=Mucilaginibacter mallensis TaxID=652787 RepID=A0A1H2A9S4_MUCMA|nr:hypothetical protein SAMN05216490_3437 [Mucilaginibacter mallensis]
MKSLLLYFYRYCLLICCCLALPKMVSAQTDADALMIPKNFYCAGAMFTNNSWKNYWEGTFKRDNGNLGTLTTNTYSIFGNYGIFNNLDVLFNVPYVTTNASAGTLKGQQGFQDLSLTLKWEPYKTKIGTGIFSTYAFLQGSTPLSNYQPDFQPMSIGLHSEAAAIRALVNYQISGFFLSASGQYIRRNDITIDRTAYYTTYLINSNRVDIPNANNYMLSAGYRSPQFNAQFMFEQFTSLGGFDIRKNDMPFPSNTMNYSEAGVLFKYSFDRVAGLELTAGGNYILNGRNVGQSTTIYGGVLYLFNLSKTK